MKYILTIFLFILLMIGIYTYAHVNRYQIFVFPSTRIYTVGTLFTPKGTKEMRTTMIKYDNWTNKTFIINPVDGLWIELGKRQRFLNR